jgi:hypothetical protein
LLPLFQVSNLKPSLRKKENPHPLYQNEIKVDRFKRFKKSKTKFTVKLPWQLTANFKFFCKNGAESKELISEFHLTLALLEVDQ